MKVAKPKSYKIKVPQSVIDKASKQNSKRCMVAQSVRQEIPGARSVDVTSSRVKFTLGKTRFVYDMPGKAAKAVELYDDAGPWAVEPFSFTLDERQCTTGPVIKHPKRAYKKRSKTTAAKIRNGKTRRKRVSKDQTHVSRRRHGLKARS